MSFTVRPIEDADIDSVIRLWTEAGVTRPWNDPRRDIELCRKGSHSTILVGLNAGAIVTTVQVGEDGHRGWVYYVAVQPELQGSGMGRRIMQAAEDWLRARGIWKLTFSCAPTISRSSSFISASDIETRRLSAFKRKFELPLKTQQKAPRNLRHRGAF